VTNFWRNNSADEDKKLAASKSGGFYRLESGSPSLEVRYEQVSPTLAYVGEAEPGAATEAAVWRVKRLDTSAGVILLYADGTAEFDKAWDSRASYSY
jgi:hypothetical protein